MMNSVWRALMNRFLIRKFRHGKSFANIANHWQSLLVSYEKRHSHKERSERDVFGWLRLRIWFLEFQSLWWSKALPALMASWRRYRTFQTLQRLSRSLSKSLWKANLGGRAVSKAEAVLFALPSKKCATVFKVRLLCFLLIGKRLIFCYFFNSTILFGWLV